MSRIPSESPTFFEEVGGHDTFERLVRYFYEGVADDDLLRPMYPEEDLTGAETRLRMFLEQYWGGPRTYSEQRGHPRLRMRHQPFVIGPRERDAWLVHMKNAIDRVGLAPEHRQLLWNYVVNAAYSLMNAPEDEHPGTRP